jgi:low affinity Fe/Cu permease
MSRHELFRRIAKKISHAVGSPLAFALAIALIVGWAITGPLFAYSDGWQLAINSTTTIVTFLVVFLIQNTQNRDSKEIHLKLDEVIHALKKARNQMLDVEDMPDEDLAQLEREFREEAKQRSHQRRYGLRNDDHA